MILIVLTNDGLYKLKTILSIFLEKIHPNMIIYEILHLIIINIQMNLIKT